MNRIIKFKENPKAGTLGLGDQGRSKMPNCVDIFQPGKGLDGRWKTNLDEFALSVNKIEDPKEKKKEFERIKAEREELERLLNVDLSGISKYWENLFIEINPKAPLDLNVPMDRVKYNVIMANNMVSPSMRESYKAEYRDAKYYVTREFEEVGDRVAKQRKYAEAISQMLKLVENTDKAILIGKYLDLGINKNTPKDNIFDIYQNYIDADEKIYSIDKFLDALKKSPEELSIKLLVLDAIKYKVIRQTEGLYQRGSITLGKSIDEIVAWLSNVIHSGELISIQEEVDLKQKYA